MNNLSVPCAVDLYPSLCSMAGIPIEKNYQGDGQDLMGDFGRNQSFNFPKNPYANSPYLAIRSGKWKLLVNHDGSDAQLYDMEKDKFEKENVADAHPELVIELSKKVCKWFADYKDSGLASNLNNI